MRLYSIETRCTGFVDLVFKIWKPKLDRVKQLLIENGYADAVLLSSIKQKVANFAAENRVVLRSVRFT